jgi:hypothetical protein
MANKPSHPNGVASGLVEWIQPFQGCVGLNAVTQRRPTLSSNAGLNDVAPLGQTKWAEQRRIVVELDALQAELDALSAPCYRTSTI